MSNERWIEVIAPPILFCIISLMCDFLWKCPTITVTSYWARWRLKSPACRLFTQPFVQAQIKESTKAQLHLAFLREIHWWPVNSRQKGPVTRKMLPFDDVIMVRGDVSPRRWQALLPWFRVTILGFRRCYPVTTYFSFWIRDISHSKILCRILTTLLSSLNMLN